MAIKVGGTTVIDDSRELSNIASVDATTVAALGAAGIGGSELEFTAGGTIAEGNIVSIDPSSPHLAFAGASPALNYTNIERDNSLINKVYFDSTRTGGQVLIGADYPEYTFSSVDLLNRTRTTLISGTKFGRGANTLSTPYIKTTTGSGTQTFKVVMTNHNVQGKLAIHNGTNGAETNLDASVIEGCSAFPVGTYNNDGGDGIAIYSENPYYFLKFQTYRINDYNSIDKSGTNYLTSSATTLFDAVQLPSEKIIVLRWARNETRVYLGVVTCSGYNSSATYNEVTIGPSSNYTYYYGRVVFDPSNENNLFVVGSNGYYTPVSLSGTTLTVGTENTSNNYGNGFTTFQISNMAYDVATSKWNVGANSSAAGNWAELTFPTSTTLGMTSLIPYNNDLQASIKVALQDTSDADIFHMISKHGPNATNAYGIIEYDSSIGPSSAPLNWVGIAASSATQGQTVKVHPIGAKVGGFSGIVPWTKYYVSSSAPNTITTTDPGPTYNLGIGVSDTEIIIVGTNGSINW